ncbi:hypothetical protein [Actinomadura madurae]|uniref:hypothetical protein n=1 Tax=Actinomadura madurae TaxID=1993 RepID=UPI0020D24351|nr:hypothetical protein [Actinomadura madurae]MCP9966155.1 hypothetical protein [Actinomadura madurae]MCP9978646.1 hypothetical protein [Actinomadura madurae]
MVDAEGAQRGQRGGALGVPRRPDPDRARDRPPSLLHREQLPCRAGEAEAEPGQLGGASRGAGAQVERVEHLRVLLGHLQAVPDRRHRAAVVVARRAFEGQRVPGGDPRGRGAAGPSDGGEQMPRRTSQRQRHARGDDPGLVGGVGPAAALQSVGHGHGGAEQDG